MATRDLVNGISAASTVTPGTYTADQDGSTIDLQAFDSAAVVVHTGSYTDGTHTFEVQEAADDGTGSADTFSAVADADLDGDEPVVDAAGDADSIFEIGYRGDKRFLRVSVTTASTTSGAAYGATIVRGHAHDQPA